MNECLLNSCAVLAIGAIFMNLVAIRGIRDQALKYLAGVLLLFTITRYVTLIIYGDRPSLWELELLRYFYFASSIGLTMTTVLAIWYAVPCFREKLSAMQCLLLFLPWSFFYLYLIIKQPTQIIKGGSYGYILALIGKWPFYLGIAQGSLILILLLLCLYGIWHYKHLQIRMQLFFIIAAQLLLMVDGMNYGMSSSFVFTPFTLTEAFGFMATYYAFSHSVRTIGKGKCT